MFLDVEKSWNLVVADRMKRHFGQKHNVRKRLWSETFRPVNPESTLTNGMADFSSNGHDHQALIIQPSSSLLSQASPEVSMSVANLAKLELSSDKTGQWSGPASKLTSEVAFWLRHLKPTMARTLTCSSIKENALDATKSDEGSSPESSDGEVATRWPGIDSVMVLYMAHQQGNADDNFFDRWLIE